MRSHHRTTLAKFFSTDLELRDFWCFGCDPFILNWEVGKSCIQILFHFLPPLLVNHSLLHTTCGIYSKSNEIVFWTLLKGWLKEWYKYCWQNPTKTGLNLYLNSCLAHAALQSFKLQETFYGNSSVPYINFWRQRRGC